MLQMSLVKIHYQTVFEIFSIWVWMLCDQLFISPCPVSKCRTEKLNCHIKRKSSQSQQYNKDITKLEWLSQQLGNSEHGSLVKYTIPEPEFPGCNVIREKSEVKTLRTWIQGDVFWIWLLGWVQWEILPSSAPGPLCSLNSTLKVSIQNLSAPTHHPPPRTSKS